MSNNSNTKGFVCPFCGRTFTFRDILDARYEDEDWCAREFGGDEVSVNILTRCPRCWRAVSIVVNYVWDGKYENSCVYPVHERSYDGL